MFNIVRTDSSNMDFQTLVQALDKDLAIRDGAEHGFYAQFNKIDMIKHVVIAYEYDLPVACGAIKQFEPTAMEVKRMYVLPEKRGQGFAQKVLQELETWAKELGYENCVLETGKKQSEAIALYKKSGYAIIENYGQYKGVENSVCLEKSL